MPESDIIVRAMADDASFRVIAARSSLTAKGTVQSQNPDGKQPSPLLRALGDLSTGVMLIRETMAPQLRVQGIVKNKKTKHTLVADSRPDGNTRGLIAANNAIGEFSLDGALLQLMRTLHDGRLHQGLIEIDGGASISTALTAYMYTSEQIESMIRVETILEDGVVTGAGGYLIQLLPEVGKGPVMLMEQRHADLANLRELVEQPNFTPKTIVEELFYGMPMTWLEESEIRYRCWCSRESVLASLASLPRKEVEELARDQQVLEIDCDYCREEYQIRPVELQGLLSPY